MMAKLKVTYRCQECGYKSPTHLGKCPECGVWDSLAAETTLPPVTASQSVHHAALWDSAAPKLSSHIGREGSAQFGSGADPAVVIPLQSIKLETLQRFSTGYEEFDRVLGGGLLPGAYYERQRKLEGALDATGDYARKSFPAHVKRAPRIEEKEPEQVASL